MNPLAVVAIALAVGGAVVAFLAWLRGSEQTLDIMLSERHIGRLECTGEPISVDDVGEARGVAAPPEKELIDPILGTSVLCYRIRVWGYEKRMDNDGMMVSRWKLQRNDHNGRTFLLQGSEGAAWVNPNGADRVHVTARKRSFSNRRRDRAEALPEGALRYLERYGFKPKGKHLILLEWIEPGANVFVCGPCVHAAGAKASESIPHFKERVILSDIPRHELIAAIRSEVQAARARRRGYRILAGLAFVPAMVLGIGERC